MEQTQYWINNKTFPPDEIAVGSIISWCPYIHFRTETGVGRV